MYVVCMYMYIEYLLYLHFAALIELNRLQNYSISINLKY
jgi:hypothetical protein